MPSIGAWMLLLARRTHRIARLERLLRARSVEQLADEPRLAACFAALDDVRGWGVRAGLATSST